jgi:hypothetical protein
MLQQMKFDNVKDRFFQELERVLDTFRKNIFVGDCNAEAAYNQETKTSQHHHQTIKLATRQKIKSSDGK